MQEDFIGAFRLVENLEGPPRRGIDFGHGRVDAEGDIDAIVDGHQSSLELAGGASPVDDVGKPCADVPLPEQCPVERVTCDEPPLWCLAYGRERGLVQNVEDPSAARNQRIEVWDVLVAPVVPWAVDPLDVPRGADQFIVCYSISARVVEIVRPFVDVLWARLNRLALAAVLPGVQDAFRGKRPHYLTLRHTGRIVGYYKVHEIVRIRQ